jgi:hypothetical protein
MLLLLMKALVPTAVDVECRTAAASAPAQEPGAGC